MKYPDYIAVEMPMVTQLITQLNSGTATNERATLLTLQYAANFYWKYAANLPPDALAARATAMKQLNDDIKIRLDALEPLSYGPAATGMGIGSRLQKARKYIQRGRELAAAGKPLAAAVQAARSFAFDDTIDAAIRAAIWFERGGDTTRAAEWYRKVLTLKSSARTSDERRQDRKAIDDARDFLAETGLRSEARYKQTKTVAEEYTGVSTKNVKKALAGAGKADTAGNVTKAQVREVKERGQALEQAMSSDPGETMLAWVLRWQWYRDTQPNLLDEAMDALVGRGPFTREEVLEAFSVADQPDKLVPLIDKLRQGHVDYLEDDESRRPYRLRAVRGKIGQGPNAELYDTKESASIFLGPGWAIYVMSPDGAIYASTHRKGRFHHSSLLASGAVAGAGELKVTNGKLVGISNKSGHYRPNQDHLYNALIELEYTFKQRLTGVELRYFSGTGVEVWPGGAREFVRFYERAEDTTKAGAAGAFESRELGLQRFGELNYPQALQYFMAANTAKPDREAATLVWLTAKELNDTGTASLFSAKRLIGAPFGHVVATWASEMARKRRQPLGASTLANAAFQEFPTIEAARAGALACYMAGNWHMAHIWLTRWAERESDAATLTRILDVRKRIVDNHIKGREAEIDPRFGR